MKSQIIAIPMAIKRKFISRTYIEFVISPRDPINDLSAIITSDVATACLIVSHSRSINAGTMRNQPPAPTRPVIVPTIHPSKIVRNIFFHF
jgi:hypothetical protein